MAGGGILMLKAAHFKTEFSSASNCPGSTHKLMPVLPGWEMRMFLYALAAKQTDPDAQKSHFYMQAVLKVRQTNSLWFDSEDKHGFIMAY